MSYGGGNRLQEDAEFEERQRNETAFTIERFRRLIPTDDEDIVSALDALRQAGEALMRYEWRAQQSIDMENRHQEARAALESFQRESEAALQTAQVPETNVAATQPSPVLGLSARVRSVHAQLVRAGLTKEREDLEEQMERMEITEGAYLERMNALRDQYNRAPDYSARSQLQRTGVLREQALFAEFHPHILATNYGPLGLSPRDNPDSMEFNGNRTFFSDRSWAHIVHPALPQTMHTHSNIPEVD
tara:strand:+ start:2307 stop:3044 length:738 start_codon:yes stop_codon:yes gene_type:complete